jgi:hypothetical protein
MPDGLGGRTNRDAGAVVAPGRDLDDFGQQLDYGPSHGDAVTQHRVVIIAVPTAQILDVTGPLEVFATASRLWPTADYCTEVVSSLAAPSWPVPG